MQVALSKTTGGYVPITAEQGHCGWSSRFRPRAETGHRATLTGGLGDHVLGALLVAAVGLPALFFRYATFQGEVVAVLYREPKKDAISILCWILIAAFCWLKLRRIDASSFSRLASRPVLIALAALLTHFGLTRLWVTVPANWAYEMTQYGVLFLLLLVLLVWTDLNRSTETIVERALVTSIGLVAMLGLLQGFWPGAAPPPINPYSEVGNPSLMGYKNPAALSVLAQLFVLGSLVASARARSITVKTTLGLLLAAELFYIVELQCRSAYLGLAVGTVVLIVLRVLVAIRSASHSRPFLYVPAGTAALIVLAALIVAAFALNPNAQGKAASMVRYATNPAAYLASDRGLYLQNTLDMAAHHPLGVGLGDWQTMYPAHRVVEGPNDFSEQFQVRRAHSDHVQVLGELGWPGIALWSTVLALVFFRAAVPAVREGHLRSAFLAAQVAAIAAAMSTDSFVEIPYNKFQLFLIVYLVMVNDARPGTERQSAARLARAPRLLVILLVSAAATAAIAMAGQTERKLVGSAVTGALVQRAGSGSLHASDSTALLAAASEAGEAWAALPGHWKCLFRSHLELVRAEVLTGNTDRARHHAIEALRLHPLNPQTMRIVTALADVEGTSSARVGAVGHVVLAAETVLVAERRSGDLRGRR
jgi:hypothetical protein